MSKRRHYTITKGTTYKEFDIYSNKKKASKGHYVEILGGMFKGIEELFTHTSRINVIRFDLLFKDSDKYIEIEGDLNKLVSDFFTVLKRRLKAWKYEDGEKKGENRGIKDIFHVFVRERSRKKKSHFHCAIAFNHIAWKSTPISKKDEQDKNHYQWIYKKIDEAWREVCSTGHVNFGSKWKGKQVNHFYCVDRNDVDEQAKLIKGLSYLSKVNTKENVPKNARIYTFSQSIGKGTTDFKLVKRHNNNQEQLEAA